MLSPNLTKDNCKRITCPRLPLAVYREIVAHLRQIEGVEAGLIEQTAPDFDYLQSQVGGLWWQCLPSDDREQKLRSILNYYEGKYGSWEQIEI